MSVFNVVRTSLTTSLLDWRMTLNNFLQSNGGTKMLTWEVYSTGPAHAVVWTAITYSKPPRATWRKPRVLTSFTVHGAQYAKAVNQRQSVAMEEAAKSTLDQLEANRRRGYY